MAAGLPTTGPVLLEPPAMVVSTQGAAWHSIATVTSAAATVPPPLETVQVCARDAGWVAIITAQDQGTRL